MMLYIVGKLFSKVRHIELQISASVLRVLWQKTTQPKMNSCKESQQLASASANCSF